MEITIPIKSLQLQSPEEQKEGELPQVNDPVSFNVEAVVKSISGGTATLDVRFINGERPSEDESAEEEDPKAKEEEDLAKAAKAADEENYS